METQTIERQRTTTAAGPATIVGCAGATAFIIAAAWFWLVTKGVTVAPAPRVGPDVGLQQGMRSYYRWQATTLSQERYYTSIAIAGFLCLGAVASFVRDLLGRDRPLARIGAGLVGCGSLLWVAGSVLLLGGHHAVGLMATHANPIQTTNSIAFTIETIGEAFALAAFALIGAGLLGLAAAGPHGNRGWARYTIIAALVMLVSAGAYATGNGNFSDLMLVASAGVLSGWLIWAGRMGGTGHQAPDAS